MTKSLRNQRLGPKISRLREEAITNDPAEQITACREQHTKLSLQIAKAFNSLQTWTIK